ncbi:LURP-one-related/scramblase family protein [Vagococcus sp. JNUCC 83]
METYYIKEHILTANVRTVIKNSQDRSVYILVGRWGVKGDVLSIYNMNGETLATVKQTTYAFPSHFDLYSKGEKIGSLGRLFSLNRDVYLVKQLNWLVLANVNKQSYRLYSLRERMMLMNKHTSYKGDYYKLSITNDELAPVCICIGAVMDYWAKNNEKNWQGVNSFLRPKPSYQSIELMRKE